MNDLVQAAKNVVDGYLAGDLPYEKIAELIKAIENKSEVICGWTIEDMYSAAEMAGKKITEAQAEEIFEKVDEAFDASVGMNWDVIQDLLEFVDD